MTMELQDLHATLFNIQGRRSETEARLRTGEEYIQYCDATTNDLRELLLDVALVKGKKHRENTELTAKIIELKDREMDVLHAMVATYGDTISSSGSSSTTKSSTSTETRSDIFEPRSSSPESRSSIESVLSKVYVDSDTHTPPAGTQKAHTASETGRGRTRSRLPVPQRGLLKAVKPPFRRPSGKSRY